MRFFKAVKQTLTANGKRLAVKLLCVQTVVIFLLGCVFLLIRPIAGYSYFLGVVGGGIAVVLPTALFAWRVFSQGGARATEQVVSNFFAGESLKIGFAAVLLIILLVYTTLPLVAVVSGYIAALIVQWLAPILFLKST